MNGIFYYAGRRRPNNVWATKSDYQTENADHQLGDIHGEFQRF